MELLIVKTPLVIRLDEFTKQYFAIKIITGALPTLVVNTIPSQRSSPTVYKTAWKPSKVSLATH